MNEFLKELFAENEKLGFDELNKKLQEKGFKLADLSKGGYVDKKKYDDDIGSLNKKFNDLDSEYKKFVEEISSDDSEEEKEYNEFMKQFNDLKASSEATAKELDLYKKKETMRNNGIESKRFMDLAMFELKDSKDFDTDVKKWVEDNKSFFDKKDDGNQDTNPSPFRTNPSMSGNPNTEIDENDSFMKSLIKGAGLKAEDLK